VGGRPGAGRRSTRILSTVLPMPGYTSRPARGPYRVPRCGAGLRRGHKRDRNPEDPKLGGCVGAARCDPGWDADRTHIPGDVISTGTPGAVVLRDGDVLECRIEGLTPLKNPVRRY
jgi:Fumarylacetoacetate (FAA) hydrolase family